MEMSDLFANAEYREFLRIAVGGSFFIGLLVGAVFTFALGLGSDFATWLRKVFRSRRDRTEVAS